jgi:putative oxidoreductase
MGWSLQRLFSTFPDGWPGLGLLLLRSGAGIPLIYSGVVDIPGALGEPIRVLLEIVQAVGGVLLLTGLWTPVAGAAITIDELWITFSQGNSTQGDQWGHVLLAVLSAGLAMLGPGAWSIDARLFGRRRLGIGGSDRS